MESGPESLPGCVRKGCGGKCWPLPGNGTRQIRPIPAPVFIWASRLSGLRRFSQAEAAYRQALRLDPTDFEVWNSLAGIAVQENAAAGGRPPMSGAGLEINPQHKLGWSNLARLVGRMGCHDKALQCRRPCPRAGPQILWKPIYHRAAAARALGRTEIVQEVCRDWPPSNRKTFRRAH